MLSFIALFFFYALLFMALLMLGAPYYWVFDLFATFAPQFVIASALTTGLLLVTKRFVHVGLLFIAIVFFGFPILDLYQKPERHAPNLIGVEKYEFSIMHLNVNNQNTRYEALINLIREERPSIVALNEFSEAWTLNIGPALKDLYPYVIEEPSADYRGMAVYSEFPIEVFDVIHLGEESSPVIKVTFSAPDITFYAAHALSPVSEPWAFERDDYIRGVGDLVRETRGAVLVAGDFNMSVFNPVFKKMLKDADLDHASRGFGWRPTWLAGTPAGAPIDHILFKGFYEVKDYRVLESVGGDHRPIIADISVYPTDIL